MTPLFERPVARLASIAAITLGTLGGCGGGGGPQRCELEGAVTYRGQAIVAGEIHFAPDTSRGNSGPGSFSLIRNGRYATTPGHGIVGGRYKLWVSGYDAPLAGEGGSGGGKPLFADAELEVDLPKEGGRFDIDVF